MKITIELKEEFAQQFELYAKMRHTQVKWVLEYALEDWMETFGISHIEYMAGLATNVMPVDSKTKDLHSAGGAEKMGDHMRTIKLGG